MSSRPVPPSSSAAPTTIVPMLTSDPVEARSVSGGGGSQPIAVASPYLVLNWCIALEGIFPPRN